MKKHILMCCLLACVFLPASAQYKIQGKLNRGSALFIPERNLKLQTDNQGNFSIENLPKGYYSLQIGDSNELLQLLKISLPYNESLSENVEGFKISQTDNLVTIEQIPQLEANEMKEVVISGASVQMQAHGTLKVDVVKTEDIFQNGYLTLTEAMANKPGVSLISTGPGIERPVIRGLSGNRILTVQNGVKLENQQWDAEHTLGLTQYGVRQVEIIKGPASFIYGSDALGGVIHFVDDLPAALNTLNAYAFTGFNSNSFGINSGVGVKAAKGNMNWGFDAGLNNQSDYYDANFNRVANSRFREIVAKANLGIKQKNAVTLFNYQLHVGYYGIVEPFEAPDTTGKVEEDHPMEFETPYHTLVHQTLLAKHTLTKGNVKYTGTLSYQFDRRKELEKNDTEENPFLGLQLHVLNADVKADFTFNPKSSLVVGFQGNQQMNSNFGYNALIPAYQQTDFSTYLLGRNSLLHNKLKMDIGLRSDFRNLQSETYGLKDSSDYMPAIQKEFYNLCASLAINYRLFDRYYIYGNLGSGYRAPNMAELTSNGIRLETQRYEIGNSNMNKETSLQGEIGVNSTHDYFSYSISAFSHQIQNYIYIEKRGDYKFKGADSFPVYEYKQKDALLTGGEISLQIYPGEKKWFLFQSAYSTVVGQFAVNNYLPLMPANKWNNELTLKKELFRKFRNTYLRIQYTQVMDQNKTGALELSTPAYQLINLGFGGDFLVYGYKIIVSAGVNNLLNEKYYDHLSRLRTYGVYNMGLNAFINIKMPLTFAFQ